MSAPTLTVFRRVRVTSNCPDVLDRLFPHSFALIMLHVDCDQISMPTLAGECFIKDL